MPLVNYSTELINQAGRVGPTMRERLAPMAQGIGGAAAGASTAIQNLVLSRGADALDAGLKELQAAGLSNPALEQFFKQTDPTNPEAVSLALDKMADLVKGGRAQEEGKKYLGEGMDEAMASLPPDATPEMIQAARRAGAMGAVGRAAKGATDLGFANTTTRAGAFAPEKVTGTEAKANATLLKAAVGEMQKAKEGFGSMQVASEVFNRVIQEHPTVWKFASLPKWATEAKSALSSLAAEANDGRQYVAKGELYSKIMSTLDGLLIKADKATGGTPEEVDAFNEMVGALGNFVAGYIKSISGAAVTDSERRFLISNLNFGNFASPTAFARSANNLIRAAELKAQAADEAAKGLLTPEKWDELTKDMSSAQSAFSGIRFVELPKGETVVPDEPTPPPPPPPGGTGKGAGPRAGSAASTPVGTRQSTKGREP